MKEQDEVRPIELCGASISPVVCRGALPRCLRAWLWAVLLELSRSAVHVNGLLNLLSRYWKLA